MTIVYLVALAAVCVVFLGVLFEAVAAVTRKPVWHSARHTFATVEKMERAETWVRPAVQLPLVSQDRREAVATEAPALQQEPRRVAESVEA